MSKEQLEAFSEAARERMGRLSFSLGQHYLQLVARLPTD